MESILQTTATAASAKSSAVLLVDDEPSVLTALQRALRPDGFRLIPTGSAADALEVLGREPVAVIVSDQRMPKMSGSEFLELARQVQPDAIRILLTGFAEPAAIIDAINRGGIFRFVAKPWDDGDLRLTLRRAIDQYNLIAENRRLTEEVRRQNEVLQDNNRLLETRVAERTVEVAAQRDELRELYAKLDQSFTDAIRVFVSLLELRDSREAGHSRRVAAVARRVAERLHLASREIRDIEIAASLHEVGKLSLPDALLVKPENQWTLTEREMVQRCPIVGQAILMGIGGLEAVGAMIYHQRERFDGRGYPDRLSGVEIPLGARILAVADAMDLMLYSRDEVLKRTPASVRDDLARQAGHQFDPRIVLETLECMSAITHGHDGEVKVTKVALPVLRPGMVLARDIVSSQGALLMPRDTHLTVTHVERIRNFARVDAISAILVYVPDSGPAMTLDD